jgi:hypothetical protein
MDSADARAKLAAQQAELMRAFIGEGGPPDGFDPARVQATADSLVRKRMQSAARAWPALAGSIGERFAERFAAFAATAPLPRHGGPLADGRAFARFLAHTGDLPDAGRLEALAVDLRHVSRPDGLVPRAGPVVRVALLRQPRRLVVAVRLPWLGERWLIVPLGGRG